MLLCADRYARRCHPIIAGFMVDYEEQTLITGMKSNQCTICHVKPAERENLTQEHPTEDGTSRDGHGNPIERPRMRTHQSTKDQIAKQRADPKNNPPADPNWVHEWDNFAWEHDFFNIHEGMMIDKLHQMYKGIVQYLIKWI